MDRKLIAPISILLVILGIVALFRFMDSGSAVLWNISSGGRFLFPLVTVAALIDSVNPCAFSILFLTIAFLLSIGRLRSDVLRIGGIYVVGLFIVYILIGLGILQTLHLFSTPHFMSRVGAWLLIGLGSVNLAQLFIPRFPVRLRIPHVSHRLMAGLMHKGSAPAAFVLGGLVGLCEFPCTGGPYLMVLGLLHDKATYLKGLGYLFYYNVLFVSPLVLIILVASNKRILGRLQLWYKEKRKTMRLASGVLMVALGVIVLLI